jgi:hypothetical protein
LLAAALLAGCKPRDSAPSETIAPGPAPSASVAAARDIAREAAVETLAGEWRVAGIDGEPFDEPYGLALSGDEGNLWWEPKCAAMWRTYRLDGTRISFGLPAHFRQPDGTTPPVCTVGLPPRLSEVFRALDAAETAARTPQNGILISGGGRSVLLFSQ